MLSQVDKARALVRRFGGEQGAEFCPSGIPISQLAEQYGTPFYLYDGGVLVERFRQVRTSLGPGVEVFYSLKANPSLALCRLLAQEQAGAEIASLGELVLARAAGFSGHDIVFAGPAKTDEELRRAVREDVFAVNVESLNEIQRLASAADEEGRKIGVGLRINPRAQLMGSHMRMGGAASQFGLDQAHVAEAVRRTAGLESLVLRGVHVYTATQVFDIDALVEHCRNVLELGLSVADQSGQPLSMIDFGGGFGVPYFDKMPEFELDQFGSRFQELLGARRSDTRLEGCRFIFELGRYLMAEAGVYVTRVVDVKQSRGKTFVATDGGMNHHLTATGNLGQLFRKPFPLLNLSRVEERPQKAVSVVGPCCTPLDVFGTDVPLAKTEAGDIIGVFYSGAYGFSASNLQFLSHPSPAEILLWQGTAHLLRPAGRAEDVLRDQQAPDLQPLSTTTSRPEP